MKSEDRGKSGLTALRSAAFEERLADARLEARHEKRKSGLTALRSAAFKAKTEREWRSVCFDRIYRIFRIIVS
jgi:hypothetical protein